MKSALSETQRRQVLEGINRGRRENLPRYEITAHEAFFRAEIGPSLNYLIACQPKSASTFAANAISEALGIPKSTYSTYGASPLELSVERMKDLANTRAVIHQHCIAHRRELGLFRAAKLKPVVIVRDIADSLISYRDHRVRASGRLDRDRRFAELSPEEQITAIVLERAQWYFLFQATWHDAIKFAHVPAIMIDYTDLTQKPEWAINRMLEHWDLDVPSERVRQAIRSVSSDTTRSNFNVGQAGRGRMLPEHLRRAIDLLFVQEGTTQDAVRSLCSRPGYGPPRTDLAPEASSKE